MNNMDNTSPVTHKPCIPKRSRGAALSEAAKALLSSPLPPELVVDFKGSALHTLTPSSSSSSSLRSSSSENNVNRPSNRANCDHDNPAYRTLSDGGQQNVARRIIESEDSSYDSDYECTESPKFTNHISAQGASTQTASGGVPPHSLKDDVSRTVSDTLVAEFNEYVNIQGSLPESKEQYSEESEPDEEAFSSGSQSYASRVEFAVKLGYTEQQVQKALAKLGLQTTQNELLAELIRLAALPGHSTCASAPTPTNSISSELKASAVHRPLTATFSDDSSCLRHIVIDGSNVAFSHGNKEVFSCRGIQLCVDWFRARGHQEITVFVPRWRKEASKTDAPISNQEILLELEKDRMLVFTPSRQVGGRRLVCYDDRYILKLAVETDGIVVSNDNYRDLASESPGFRKIIEERILMYSFVNDRFMPPEDPLGRNGPKLDAFLRKTARPSDPSATAPPCPYGKKCTYGNKCKYYHPERGNLPHKSVTERLAEQAMLEAKARTKKNVANKDVFKTFSLPGSQDASKMPSPVKKTPLARTKSIVPTVRLDLNDERTQLNVALRPPPTFNVPPPALDTDWRHLDVTVSDSPDDETRANHHPVVQRQLTLDPYSSDPRLFGTLAPPYPPPPFGMHSLVTRNASAPAAHSQMCSKAPYERVVEAHRAQRLNSTSDTQLNLCGNSSDFHSSMDWGRSDPFDEVPVVQHQPMQQHQWACRTTSLPNQQSNAKVDRETNKTEIREKLYYHLAAIFPEEQVRQVMQRLPNETDAQKICAAILAFYPK